MFGYRLQELGCDGQNDLTARGKVTIWGGKRQIHRADDERKRVGARLGERGVRGRRGGLAGMGVTWSILLNLIPRPRRVHSLQDDHSIAGGISRRSSSMNT